MFSFSACPLNAGVLQVSVSSSVFSLCSLSWFSTGRRSREHTHSEIVSQFHLYPNRLPPLPVPNLSTYHLLLGLWNNLFIHSLPPLSVQLFHPQLLKRSFWNSSRTTLLLFKTFQWLPITYKTKFKPLSLDYKALKDMTLTLHIHFDLISFPFI